MQLSRCAGGRSPPGAEPRKPDAETAGEEARRTLATGPERDFRCFQAGELSLDPSGHVSCLPRKEVIQPHLPVRLPCYDFTPIIYPTLGGWLQKVTSPTSGVTNSRGVTGGVYKARERIHRGVLIRDY